MTGSWRTVRLGAPIAVLALLVAVASWWSAAPHLGSLVGDEWGRLLLFLVAIALGETARLTILTGRETAPMSTAAALGLAFSTIASDGRPAIGADVVIATISAGMLVGQGLRRARGAVPQWGDVAARLLGAAVAPVLFRQLDFRDHTLLDWQAQWEGRRWLVALVMLLVGSAAMVVDLTLEACIRADRQEAPLLPAILDEYRSVGALASALVTSGALIALAEVAIGVASVPLFLFPLVLTYFAVQRYASIRTTYRQTIGALSSLTDLAGYTRAGHGSQVCDLAVAVGRDLGMGHRELTDLEYAALLHDLGQVALREPIPQGATVMAAPADQQRIAQDGAEIVRSTGVLDEVATILEAQTTPYRQVREFGQDLPLSSRIIKVANAYVDLAGPDESQDEHAMERIHLGLGYEYDPHVVDSLSRVLTRRRRAAGA
ncbi:metal-dependent phosphohydrolase [Phycicoccus ginsengisoli]